MINNKCQLVRNTCRFVIENAQHVKINPQKIDILAQKYHYTSFNEFDHHHVSGNQQFQLFFLFVLDSLNFCFWPLEGFEYEHLASSVKKYIESQGNLEKLAKITEEEVKKNIFGGNTVPLLDQRARILRQMSLTVLQRFEGSFQGLIKSADKSVVKLLTILTANFENFQDHSVYKGYQIHFYKRSQILIGDIYAKFNGKGIGQFHDIQMLTMFPDYRVPQILNEFGILEYSPNLQEKIDKKQEIESGTKAEIQIRASSVWAVEMMRDHLRKKGKKVSSIEVDWFLWEEGETNLQKIRPHHRTFTIYY